MRNKVALPFLILGLGVVILLLESPQFGYSQGKGGKGGTQGFKRDPGKIWDDYLDKKGRGYIVISEQYIGKAELAHYAKKIGVTDDKITKDQYLKFSEMREQITEEMKAAGTAPTYGKGAFGKGGGAKGGGATGNPPPTGPTTGDKKGGPPGDKKFGGPPGDKKSADPKVTAEDQADKVERAFKSYDRDGDGYLNQDEIQGTKSLKSEWQKWDADKDTKVNLEEWRSYMKARDQQFQEKKDAKAAERPTETAKSTSSGGIEVITINEYTRPDNWRAGKLPDNLPDWFKEYDLNKDGQVAHHEWLKKSTKPISEFFGMDKNDDGLLTPDEVLRTAREATAAATGKTTVASATRPEEKKDERKGKGKGKGK